MTVYEYNDCVDKYSDSVYRFVLKNIRDEHKAKDVVQESFKKMWLKVKSISTEKARSYLFTTAYHTLIDETRRNKKYSEPNENTYDNLSCENQYSDLKDVLNKALSKLPEIQRAVVLLRDYEGYSYKEISKIADINESQVKVYIYRARMFLRKYIGSIEAVI